jgi:hypothetical protein
MFMPLVPIETLFLVGEDRGIKMPFSFKAALSGWLRGGALLTGIGLLIGGIAEFAEGEPLLGAVLLVSAFISFGVFPLVGLIFGRCSDARKREILGMLGMDDSPSHVPSGHHAGGDGKSWGAMPYQQPQYGTPHQPQQPAGGFGQPQPYGGYGAPPAPGNYGAPQYPQQPQMQMQGYGAPPAQAGGYGGPPQPPQPQYNAYGAQPGYGAPPPMGGAGGYAEQRQQQLQQHQQQQHQYGGPQPQQQYGGPPPQPGEFGGPSIPHFGGPPRR